MVVVCEMGVEKLVIGSIRLSVHDMRGTIRSCKMVTHHNTRAIEKKKNSSCNSTLTCPAFSPT